MRNNREMMSVTSLFVFAVIIINICFGMVFIWPASDFYNYKTRILVVYALNKFILYTVIFTINNYHRIKAEKFMLLIEIGNKKQNILLMINSVVIFLDAEIAIITANNIKHPVLIVIWIMCQIWLYIFIYANTVYNPAKK